MWRIKKNFIRFTKHSALSHALPRFCLECDVSIIISAYPRLLKIAMDLFPYKCSVFQPGIKPRPSKFSPVYFSLNCL